MIPTFNSEISEGAKLLHQQTLQAAKKNPEIHSLYKGSHLLFSPLMDQPKILLIGFNSGGGYFNWYGKIVEKLQPLKALEYYLNTHPLTEQTKILFRQAGREDDLQHHTVKTKFYFWATDNVADFRRLMKILPEELRRKMFHMARVWTKQIIEALQPDLIIAKGFKAFGEIEVLFPNTKILKTEYSKFFKSRNIRVLG